MYIYFRDPKTGKQTPLVEMIDTTSLTLEEQKHLARLAPEEEYMILAGALRERNLELIRKERLRERYLLWMKKQGREPVSEQSFDTLIASRYPGIQEILIGEKRYWYGVRLKNDE